MFSIIEVGDILVIGQSDTHVIFMYDRYNDNYIRTRKSNMYQCANMCVEIYDVVGNDAEKLERCFIAAVQVYGSNLMADITKVRIDPKWVYNGFVNIQGNVVGFCPAHFCVEHQQNTQEIARAILTFGTGVQPVHVDVHVTILQMWRLKEMLQFQDVRRGNMYVFNALDSKYDIVTCVSMPDYVDVDLNADCSFRYLVDGTTSVVPDQLDIADGIIGCVYANIAGVCFYSHSNNGKRSSEFISWLDVANLQSMAFKVWYIPNVNNQPMIPSLMFDLNRQLPSVLTRLDKSQHQMNDMPLSSFMNLDYYLDGNDASSVDDDAVSVMYDSVASEDTSSV